MFTAIILACTIEGTECRSFANPALFASEEECLKQIGFGIAYVEERRWVAHDWKCIAWSDNV